MVRATFRAMRNCWPAGPTNDVVGGDLSRPAGPGWGIGWPVGPGVCLRCGGSPDVTPGAGNDHSFSWGGLPPVGRDGCWCGSRRSGPNGSSSGPTRRPFSETGGATQTNCCPVGGCCVEGTGGGRLFSGVGCLAPRCLTPLPVTSRVEGALTGGGRCARPPANRCDPDRGRFCGGRTGRGGRAGIRGTEGSVCVWFESHPASVAWNVFHAGQRHVFRGPWLFGWVARVDGNPHHVGR
jgi:hypothetical protein